MGTMDGGGDPQRLRGRGTRFRDDLFTESASGDGWLAAIDTDINFAINGGGFRFRYCMTNEDGAESPRTCQLRYSHNGGAFFTINASASLVVRVIDTTFWANQDDSTDFSDANDLYTAAWADTTNNYLVDAGSITGNASFPAPTRRLESEWKLELQEADVSVGDTVDFRGYAAGNAFTQGYDHTPRMDIVAAVAAGRIPYPYQQRVGARIWAR